MYKRLCNEYEENIERLFYSSNYIGRIFKINKNQLFLVLLEDKMTHYCYGYEIHKSPHSKEVNVKMPAVLKMYETKELEDTPIVNTVHTPILIKCANVTWEHLSEIEVCGLLAILQTD